MDCAWWVGFDGYWRWFFMGVVYTVIRCRSREECWEVLSMECPE